jgi:hypothetical protein
VPRPLYLHVGSGKTGTSALQLALWSSTDALTAAGIATPLVGRGPHVREILHPLGWVPGSGFTGEIDRRSLGRLGARLRRATGVRVVLSNEDLAEAGPSPIAALIETAQAADLDVQVLVTARDWAQQLPSEWQQFLKDRLMMDYETFLARARDRDGPVGERFWRRQDVLGICERWGASLEPKRVHVIVVPPSSIDRGAIFQLFGDVVGFDPSLLTRSARDFNASFGYREAEVLRRLNVALGDRLPDFVHEYLPAIRNVLIRRVLPRGASARIPLPPHHVQWVRRTSEERVAALVDRGYHIHGDPKLLVPAPGVGRPVPDLDATEIADVALRTLADFAVARFGADRAEEGPPRSAVSERTASVPSELRRALADRIRVRRGRARSR